MNPRRQAQYEALRALDEQGRLNNEVLVDEARNPEHPCHPEFEWDDTVAAHAHRLSQAGALTARFRVEYHPSPDVTVKVRAFTNVPSQKRSMDGDKAMANYGDELREGLRRDLRSLIAKHGRFGPDTILEELRALLPESAALAS